MGGGALVLLMALAACSTPPRGTSSARGEATASRAKSAAAESHAAGSSQRTYRVVAPILHRRGMRPPLACHTFLQSLPPAGCGGVRVTGYDFRRLPGVRHVGTTWWTGPLLLVGTWNGHVLTLTQPPSPRRMAGEGPAPPPGCRGEETRATAALRRKLTRQHSKLNLLELSPCKGAVWILVGAADPALVASLHRRFGHHVLVRGWLRPA